VRLSVRLRAARAMAERIEAARDAAIRTAAASGVSRVDLARQLGVARSRLYVILEQPADDDGDVFEWLATLEEAAYARWESNGNEGDPDDYWPSTL
jgi:hypothetical protein